MAWRNLWRNRRRTLITVASVFFAIFFALIMRSLQLGTYDHMFRNAIESYTGYIQIQHEDFWDNKIVDNTFAYTPELEQIVMSLENADRYSSKIRIICTCIFRSSYQRSSCNGDRPGKGISFFRCQEQTGKVLILMIIILNRLEIQNSRRR